MRVQQSGSVRLVSSFQNALRWKILPSDIREKLDAVNTPLQFRLPIFMGAVHRRGDDVCYVNFRIAKIKIWTTSDYYSLILEKAVYIDQGCSSGDWKITRVIKTVQGKRENVEMRRCFQSSLRNMPEPFVAHGWTTHDDQKSIDPKVEKQLLEEWDKEWSLRQTKRRAERKARSRI
jgi:hypothetical protein